MPWVALAVGAAGALAGSMGSRGSSSGSSNESSGVNLRDFGALNQGQSGLENQAYNQQVSSFADLSKLVGNGPGGQEVTANNQFQFQYGNQLQGLLNKAANPNQQENFATAQQYFAPQQTALNQQFQQQGIESNRLAARLGRAGNDPVLNNKLAQEKTRQQTMLNSEIGAFGQQLPAFQANQIMGIGNQLSNLRQGLATQAMNNRQTLLSMGNQLASSERNYRLQTADRFGSNSSTGSTQSGGGLGGAITGGIAGFGAGMGMMGTQNSSAVTPYTGTSNNGKMGSSPVP